MSTIRFAELYLEDDACATMIGAALAARGRECCGALVGRIEARDCSRVLEAWPLPNRAASTEREYLIAAGDVRACDVVAKRRGLDIVGFYHSHPDGTSRPSATDLEQAWPGYLYAIIDAASGAVVFWKLADDRSAFLPVATLPS